ncbi:MAG: SH3 domain-containing protein [Bacilli bacterium]|nr:SH3 domain-containing protein [Bacilli bacterium]
MKNIRKRFLSGVVAGIFILLPGMSGKVKAEEFKETEDEVISQSETLMYNGDNLNSNAITNIKINEELFRLLEIDDFDLINYDEVNKIGVTLSEVNFRLGAGTNYKSLRTIKSGEIVDILYQSSNGWYLVNYQGTYGFISMDYSKIIDFDLLEQQISELPQVVKKVEATTDVNIRELPSTESNVLGLLKKGKRLNYVCEVSDKWIEVTNGTNVGYIKKDYLKPVFAIDSEYYKNICMTHDTKVYDYPYANIVSTLPKYETAFVYGETDDFYLIDSEGTVGYVRKIDTYELNGTYVVVDISDQKVRLYNDALEILSDNVVTGKDETPSHLGYTKVKSKQKNRYLKKFDVTVDYWIGFNDYGEGLHDARWRHGKFGGEIYHKKGSHGCINTPNDAIKQIYDEVSIGDKVLIKR